MSTRVVNLYKEKFEVYIGRARYDSDGYFGNPFPLKQKSTEEERNECLRKFREYFYERIGRDPEFRKNVELLRGKTLGCFCKPKSCHGDIIKEFLDLPGEAG